MLLPQTRAVDAIRIAERVRAHIARLTIYADGTPGCERVPVTVSIGGAALDVGSRRELTELRAAADAALYRAKASGRDQVQMLSTSRGLSAVRPPAGEMPATAAFPRGAQLPAEDVEPDGGQLPDGAGLEDAVGDDSTAATSALAVTLHHLSARTPPA